MLGRQRTGYRLKTSVCYVFPQLNANVYGPAARRWADSYLNSPPGESDHELVVILNGGNGHGPYQENALKPLAPRFIEHNNWGKDLGAFQMAAEALDCDFLVCLGSFVQHHHPGWLDALVRAFEDNGPGMYGYFAFHHPSTHIRTTAFAFPPDLLNSYPTIIGDRDRYPAEHGPNSLTLWTQRMGFGIFQVTRSGVFEAKDFHHVDREEAWVIDQHLVRAGITA